MIKYVATLIMSAIALGFAQDNTADSSAAPVAAMEYVNDSPVVQSILDQCGIKDRTASDAAKFENGRAISLDLSNKDVAKDGIKSIPADIGKLTALKAFICRNNNLMTVPSEIGNCTQLEKLDFNSNSINELPAEIGKLVNLTDIDLRYNQLSALPPTFADLKNLKYLRLWCNMIASLDESITKMPSLEEIYMKDNRLKTLPMGILTMKSLKYIDIIGNKICDPDPKIDGWLKTKDKLYRQTQKCW